MSDSPAENGAPSPVPDEWYLKKNDGNEYGPETLETMAAWAGESRVVSGNTLSSDRKNWIPVEEIPELGMSWVAQLPDGRRYGPFNILATEDLLSHKVLPPQARLVNRGTGQETTARAYLEDGTLNIEKEEAPPEPPAEEPRPARKKSTRKKKAQKKAADSTGNDLFKETAPPDDPPPPAPPEEEPPEEPPEEEPEIPPEPEEDPVVEEAPASEEPAPKEEPEQPDPVEETSQEPENPSPDTRIAELESEVEALQTSLAERDESKAVKSKELASLKRELRKLEADKDAIQNSQAAAESDTAEKTEALEKKASEASAALQAAEEKHAKAIEELEEVQKKLARRTAIEDQKLKEALRERNTLATLVDAESSRISRLKMLLCLLVVVLLIMGISLLAGRGCKRKEELPPGLSEIKESSSGGSDAAPQKPSGPPIIEGVDGVRMLYSRTGGIAVFEQGVFSSLTTLAPHVEPILAELGPYLRKYARDYSIIVVGHTDDRALGPRSRYRTNDGLARDRAREFARALSRECGLPMSALRAVSARDEEPPYPNTDAESRARNRTVVIKLVRHASN